MKKKQSYIERLMGDKNNKKYIGLYVMESKFVDYWLNPFVYEVFVISYPR